MRHFDIIARQIALGACLAASLSATLAATVAEAEAARLARDFSRAISLYSELAEQEPQRTSLFYQLGAMLATLGRYEEAARSFEKGLTLNPKDPELRKAYARALAWSGNLLQAEQIARALTEEQPRNIEGYNLLASVQAWSGHFEEALRTCKLSLEIAPADIPPRQSWLRTDDNCTSLFLTGDL